MTGGALKGCLRICHLCLTGRGGIEVSSPARSPHLFSRWWHDFSLTILGRSGVLKSRFKGDLFNGKKLPLNTCGGLQLGRFIKTLSSIATNHCAALYFQSCSGNRSRALIGCYELSENGGESGAVAHSSHPLVAFFFRKASVM